MIEINFKYYQVKFYWKWKTK